MAAAEENTRERIRLHSPVMSLSTAACLMLIVNLNLMSPGRVTCGESSPASQHIEKMYQFGGLQHEELLVTNSRTAAHETRSDNQLGRVPHRSRQQHARPPLGPIVSTYEQIALTGSQVRLICPHAVAHHPTPEANSFATQPTEDQQGLLNTKQQQQQQQQQLGWRSHIAVQSGRDGRNETKAWTQQSSSGGSGGLGSRIVNAANYNGREQIRWFRNHVPVLNHEPLSALDDSRLALNHGRQRRRNEFKLDQTTTGTGRVVEHAQPRMPHSPSGQDTDESGWAHQTDPGLLSELNQARLLAQTSGTTRGSELVGSLQGIVVAKHGAAEPLGFGPYQKLETARKPGDEVGESSGENVNELNSYEQSDGSPDSWISQMAQSDQNGGGPNTEPRLQDDWYVSKYGELVMPGVAVGAAGRYTCLYAGRQSELILDVIADDGGNEPEGVTRSRAGPGVGQGANQRTARTRARRAEARDRAHTSFSANRPHALPPPAPSQALKLLHVIESDIVSDADLEIIPGLMYTKQQLYCPVASRVDLHLAFRQLIHWLARNFCNTTGSHASVRSRSHSDVVVDSPLKCARLARQLVARLLNLARHNDLVGSQDSGQSCDIQGDSEDKFFQIAWYKDNRLLEFHPDGRGVDKNINVKLINFIDQFKLSTTTTNASGSNNNNENNNASEDNENKALEVAPQRTSLAPGRQIDMSEPGLGPSSLLREQGRQRRASAASENTGSPVRNPEQDGGSLYGRDLCPPSQPPMENLILEIDGIRRDKAGRYTCALQFNRAKLVSLLEGLKRLDSASAAAALADNRSDLDRGRIARPHGKRDKSKCCDLTGAAASKVVAQQESGRHVRQITRRMQSDGGLPPPPAAPEIESMEVARPIPRAAAAALAPSEVTLQSGTEDNKQAQSSLDSSFRAPQQANLGDESNAVRQSSIATTKPIEQQQQQLQLFESAIPVVGEQATASSEHSEGDQQQETHTLVQQIRYLESILNGSIPSDESLNYIEQRIYHRPATAAPPMALQTFALLITERPANSCTLWATINEANEAYSRRKFVDFERLKRRETSISTVTDHPVGQAKADGVDLTTNYGLDEGKQTNDGESIYADGDENGIASLAAGGSLIKDAASANEEVPANRAFNYVNERNQRKLNQAAGGPVRTMGTRHTIRATQRDARSQVKLRRNGQIAHWSRLGLHSREDEVATSPGGNRLGLSGNSSNNDDQVRSSRTSINDNDNRSGGSGDKDEELLWAASQYLYMHMRAYASSSLYGVQVDVEWSNERQRHYLSYNNMMVEQAGGQRASDDEQTSTSGHRPEGQRVWSRDSLAPFATIDLVAGQDLHLQCTAQALGRLPDVKWYKRINSAPESLPLELKRAMLKRSLGPSRDELYWPVTHLDLLGSSRESGAKFVCSQSVTIFDNLLNQTFTVINSLKLSHYTGDGVSDRVDLSIGPEESSRDDTMNVELTDEGELRPSIFACMVDADVRHQEATLGVRFRRAPSGKRLPIGLRKRLRARSLMEGRQQRKSPVAAYQFVMVQPMLPPSPEMLNVDPAAGVNNGGANYDFLRRDQLYLPLGRSAIWSHLSGNGTYLDASGSTRALDSYNGPAYGLMSPIMLTLVIAFLSSSLIALVYLTLKSYRALTNFRQDDEDCALRCGQASGMMQIGERAAPEEPTTHADTLCEFSLKDNSVRHRMLVEDQAAATQPGVFSYKRPQPNLVYSFPTSEELNVESHYHHASGHADNDNSNGHVLYYDAHFHDLDSHYIYRDFGGTAAAGVDLGQGATNCSPSCCPHTMTNATEDDNMLDLLSRAL